MKIGRIILCFIGVMALMACQNGKEGKSDSEVMGAATTGVTGAVEPVEVLNLYDGPAPGSENWTHQEGVVDERTNIIFNITTPTLAVYLPDPSIATGSAMVVCPGGGFSILSYASEGTMVAEELCKRGIAALVLKYRTHPIRDLNADERVDSIDINLTMAPMIESLVKGGDGTATGTCLAMEHTHLAFEDADRAMNLARENAAKWNIKPDHIGIMGFSAGAITTMHQALVHSEGGKPDFVGVIYGGWTSDVKAPADAAPVFLCAPVNDIFFPEESMDVYKAWREAKVPVELHYYNVSVHGFGAVPTGKSSDMWIDEMVHFMKDVEFVK